MERSTKAVVAFVAAVVLTLVAGSVVPVGVDAAWRRVTRDGGRSANDELVCRDGIRVVFEASGYEGPQPGETMSWGGVRVTSEAELLEVDPPRLLPAGADLLADPPTDGLELPEVFPGDPLWRAGDSWDGFRRYWAVSREFRWTHELEPGTTAYFWPAAESERPYDDEDPGWESAITVADCSLFGSGPEPVTVRFDANVFDGSNTVFPDTLNFTVFEVRGVAVDPRSVRFGAPGREARVEVFVDGDRTIGVANLRERGLGCEADTASIVGLTSDGSPFSATDSINSICK